MSSIPKREASSLRNVRSRALRFFAFVYVFGLLGFQSTVNAQVPTATLERIFPPGAKSGSTLDVKVEGTNLDETTGLVFSDPRIVAKVKTSPATEILPAKPLFNQFTVTVPKDVVPGSYEVRTVGRFGMSTPRRFVIGVDDELMSVDNNRSADAAMPVSVNSVVNARAVANASQFFKFALQDKEKVTIECQAAAIDSKLNPVLTLYDLEGRQLKRIRSSGHQAAVLFFQATRESQYIVEVQDAIFGGGNDFFYRLRISDRPYLSGVYPNVMTSGTDPTLTLLGWNLPGGEQLNGEMEQIQRPANEVVRGSDQLDDLPLQPSSYALDWMSVALRENDVPVSNQLPIFVSALPVALENESAESTTVSAPCEVSARFIPGTESDDFEFDAKGGEVFYIDAFSHRLGHPSDLILSVHQRIVAGDGKESWKQVAVVDDPGNRAATVGPDFSTTTDDPTVRFQAPADGRYRVRLKDQFGTYAEDPSAIYRLCIRRPTPDFRLVCHPVTGRPANGNQILPKAIALRKGERIKLQVKVQRRDGFSGPVTLSAAGLPTGVEAEPVTAHPTQSTVDLVFHALDSATQGHSQIQIIGEAKIGEKELTRPAATTAVTWGTGNKTQVPAFFRRTAGIGLSVLPAGKAPVIVEVGSNDMLETSLGGKLSVPVKLSRINFGDQIKLVARNLPKQLKPADLTIAKDKSEAAIELFVKDKNTAPGVYSFTLAGDAKFKFQRNPEALSRAEAELNRVDGLIKKIDADSATLLNQVKAAMQSIPEFDAKIAAAKAKRDKVIAEIGSLETSVAKLAAAIEKGNAKGSTVDPILLSAAQAQLKTMQTSLESEKENRVKADNAVVAAEKMKAEALVEMENLKKQVATLADRKKRAEALKNEAKKAIDSLKKQTAPKDLFYVAVSNPIEIRVTPSPIDLAPVAVQTTAVGSKLSPEVKLQRKYGFADTVTLTAKGPNGVPGIVTKPATVTKDQTSAVLPIEIQDNCPPGDHVFELIATAKFNNVDVQSKSNFVIKVTPKSNP